MSKPLPFGWHDLSAEAQQLIRDHPERFERVTLTDGPVAHGRLFAGPALKPQQMDLFADVGEMAPSPDQMEMF